MQAMAIVNDRHSAAKPTQVDPKTGKPLPPSAAPNGRASPPMDSMADGNTGFFGSFFASKNKKKMAAMEAPPPTLKASGTLSEREGVEVEVISAWRCIQQSPVLRHRTNTDSGWIELLINSYYGIVKRTMIDMVPKAIMLNLVQ